MNTRQSKRTLWGKLPLLLVFTPAVAYGQGSSAGSEAGPIEEVVVIGRQQQSATDVISERINKDVPSDFLDAEAISRVGDSTVAAALRRVPGLTLVNEQFVYVRGLGERYSSSTLNGAIVPSPDLTRDILPLDIFPTTVIESLEVQKGYSPPVPAAFGGGSIDIRTRGVPDGPLVKARIGSGFDSESSGDGLTYPGGSDDKWGEDDGTRALSDNLTAALRRYRGSISPQQIFQTLNQEGQPVTLQEAEALNRELALELYRDVGLKEQSLDPDISAELSLGNKWFFGERWELGALGVAAYDNEWRNRKQINRNPTAPESQFTRTDRTTQQVNLTGAANFGLRFTSDHEIATTSMLLRNTEDEAALADGFNFNNRRADGRGVRNYLIRFEERELRLHQIRGSHEIGDETLELVGFVPEALRGLRYDWYYSDAVAETNIPSELVINALNDVDPVTGEVLATRVAASGSAADYRFSDLYDDVLSYGWRLTMPFSMGPVDLEMIGGWDYNRKGREFEQLRFGLGTTGGGSAVTVLQGRPEDVFTDENILDPANRFGLTVGGIGTESYLAAQTTEAAFGKIDAFFGDSWRLSMGARWEQFNQVSVAIDRLAYDIQAGQVRTNVPLEDLVLQEDDYYPAVALTYIRPNFLAEEFQLRFGWSETVARPDIREVSNATYVDPLSEARVTGNPALQTSPLKNYDVRAEWFFASGDNFTVSLFLKEIDRPIETVQQAASDQAFALGFINGESAEVYGVELEALKSLGFISRVGWLGGWWDSMFVSGNVTVSDSEIDMGERAAGLTNQKRRLTQHSKYVSNVQIGYDSLNGRHSAALSYNVFGERIYFAGRNGAPDAYEKPFHSLDFTYSYYPTERLMVKAKLKNLLEESVELERGGISVFERQIGLNASLELTWEL